jgi:hypothetical protein
VFESVNVTTVVLVAPRVVLGKLADCGVTESRAGACALPLIDAEVVPPGEADTCSRRLCEPRVGAVGAKVTVTVHEPFGGTAAEQVLVWLKPAPEPTRLTVGAPVADPPMLVTVNTFWLLWPCSTSPKSNGVGLMLNAPGATPVPVRLATCEPPEVPDTVRVADLLPCVPGVNSTTTSQLAPPASVEPQPFD